MKETNFHDVLDLVFFCVSSFLSFFLRLNSGELSAWWMMRSVVSAIYMSCRS